MKKIILDLDLVPKSCWFNNVRSHVSKKEWDIIRHQIYNAAYNVCEICGGVGAKHPVECHEVWHYDDKKLIQKLVKMIALCPNCHMVKHMGLAQLQNRGEKALAHFIKINNFNKIDAINYINDCFIIWGQRSKKIWKLDISLLKDYGVDTDKLNGENSDGRKNN